MVPKQFRAAQGPVYESLHHKLKQVTWLTGECQCDSQPHMVQRETLGSILALLQTGGASTAYGVEADYSV